MVRCCRRRRECPPALSTDLENGGSKANAAAPAGVIGPPTVDPAEVAAMCVDGDPMSWKIPSEAILDIEEGYFLARPSRALKTGDDSRSSDVHLTNSASDPFNLNSAAVVVKGVPCQDSNNDGPPLSNNEDVDVIQGVVCEDAPPSLELLGRLCRTARVMDAVTELERVERIRGPLDSAMRLDGGVPVDFLRLVHKRMRECMDRSLGPGMRSDVKWNRVEVREAKIDPEFKFELGIRHAEGAEVDAKGPASQLIFCGKMANYPLSLSQYTGLLVEADLLKKVWIKDCELLEATCGKAERLQGAVVNSHVFPALLPMWGFQELVVRGFSVCHEPPVDCLRGDAPICQAETSPADATGASNGSAAHATKGGLLVYEVAPPEGITELDGWPLPAAQKGVIRLAGVTKVLWVTQSANRPDCCDILATARMGLPLGKMFLPMRILKQMAADLFRDSLLRIKQGCADHWSELDYERRASQSRDFYGEVSRIQQKASAGHSTDT